MQRTPQGLLRVADDLPEHLLALEWRADEGWRKLALEGDGPNFTATAPGLRATLRITPAKEAGTWSYEISLASSRPTRLRLLLQLPGAADVFHLIPGIIHGDNNLAKAEPGHFPNLTTLHPESDSCAPEWETRADRAAVPVSMIAFSGGSGGGGVAGVSIDPYSAGRPLAPAGRDSFIRNGVVARLAHDHPALGPLDHACGVTLGYANLPRTFMNKDQWLPATAHFVTNAKASGRIFLMRAESRLAVHAIVRAVYRDHHESPATPISARAAATALTDALLDVNWHDENGRNADGSSAGRAGAHFGGGIFKSHFTNMRCIDPLKRNLTAWRTLAEVGWTGGGVIGYPLLRAAHALDRPVAAARAIHAIDLVAAAGKPETGLLWECNDPSAGKRLNWWWSGYLVKDCHSAYVQGSGLYYLLKALEFSRKMLGQDHPAWLATACKALDTMVALQEPDGRFGFTYAADRPAILDREGFAGVWFVPALALAHRLTGERRYLDAASRGLDFYHAFVRGLSCWGTPLDTWKAPDEEGNLGFIRGARLLHEITRDERFLAALVDGAHYEYLWRYGYRARPEYAPLKDSHWSSCGGSITSVSNPHIHPMGIYISADLQYLARATGDAYHAQRADDGIRWGINCVSLYPEVTGYGVPGVLTERFCPTDALTIETFPDGSPSSMWFSYNGWAAAAVLEGLVETL
ncbi:MAG: hypothetical protein NTW19_17520 [Planctomycetota bacterium]|nr:hypothetical protein [Planctomycetota bacterium]